MNKDHGYTIVSLKGSTIRPETMVELEQGDIIKSSAKAGASGQYH